MSKRIIITYERLYELYIVQNLTQEHIAIEFGYNEKTIGRLLKKHNIVKTKEQIYETKKQTWSKNLGVEHPLQSKDVQEKCKQTNLKRRGVEYPSQSKDVQEKYKQTNLERLGVEHPLQSKDVQEKCKQTNMDRRGVEYPLQNEEVKKKAEETNLKKYNCKCSLQNEEVKKKAEQTNLKKYNCKNPMQNEDVQKKAEQTNLKKYNCKNPMQNEDVQKKREETNLERLGVVHPSQRHIPPYKIEIYSDKDKLINWLYTINYKERTSRFCSKELGISKPEFNRYIIKYNIFNLVNHTKSEWENETKRWFESNYPNLTVQYNTRSIIKPYELDIYIPNYNIAIELNGSYWHSDKVIQEKKHMSAEEYHNLKEQLCKENNITLYTIWENEITEYNTLEDCLEKIMYNIIGD